MRPDFFARRQRPLASRSTPVSFTVCLLLCSLCLLRSETKEPVPALFTEELAPQVLSVEPPKDLLEAYDPKASDGVALLMDDVVYVTEEGEIYELRQRVYGALTESGAESIAEEYHAFRPDIQKIWLLEGETIQPDGRRVPVRQETLIFKNPEREADVAIYTGRKEMLILFPEMDVGSVSRSLVCIHHARDRMPGEFIDYYLWSGSWPWGQQRLVLDVPASWEERLQYIARGKEVPEPVREELENGRVRLIWESRDTPIRRYESKSGPRAQTGPVLWISTVKDWDAFAVWYAGLMEESSELSEALRKQVRQWLDDNPDADPVQLLLDKVSRDVRYASLNFGYGGFQPQAANEVWSSKIGDCKDKTNLLRLMLREAGIPAYLALINTRHLGLVEKRIPHYGQFNHAILALPQEDGSYQFSDPTIAYTRPGLYSPSVGNRDLLVVRDDEGRGEWVRSPETPGGSFRYTIEATLNRDGSLSGWYSLEALGYYASSYMDYYRLKDRYERRLDLRDELDDLIPGAEVIDFEMTSSEAWDGHFEIRTYFRVESYRRPGSEQVSFALPRVDWMYPKLGEEESITRPIHLWPHAVDLNFRIELGDGWKKAGTTDPFRLESDILKADAGWTFQEDKLEGAFRYELRYARLDPADFPSARAGVRSFKSWCSQPVSLVRSEDGAATGEVKPEEPTVDLEDFPVMPTGSGQLNLVDSLFPSSGNKEKRRVALRRTAQYFPDDLETVFTAKMYLAVMDWQDDENEQALKQVQALREEYGERLNLEDLGWADYIIGRCLVDLEREDEALTVFEALLDEQYTDFRRGWSGYRIAVLKEEEQPEEALGVLDQILVLQNWKEPAAYTLYAQIAIKAGQADRLRDQLAVLLTGNANRQGEILEELAEEANRSMGHAEPAYVESLLEVLSELEGNEYASEDFLETIRQMQGRVGRHMLYAQLQQRIREYVEERKGAWFSQPSEVESEEDLEALRSLAERYENQGQREMAALSYLTILLEDEAGEQFPEHFWTTLSYVFWQQKGADVKQYDRFFELLLEISEELPEDTNAFLNSYYLRARSFEFHEDYEGAIEVYKHIASLEPDADWQGSLYSRWAEALIELGRYAEALEKYEQLVPLLTEYDNIADLLFKGLILAVREGDYARALRWLEQFEDIDEESLAEVGNREAIEDFLAQASDPEALQAWWKQKPKWWPQWEALRSELGIEARTGLYWIGDRQRFNGALNEATRDDDREAFNEQLVQLVHACRYQPGMCVHYLEWLSNLTGEAPDARKAFYDLAFALIEHFKGGTLYQQRRLLIMSVAHHLDEQKPNKALSHLERFQQIEHEYDAQTETMHRMWVFWARQTGERFEEIGQRLREDLERKKVYNRPAVVESLANLYRLSGKPKEEIALLESELKTPELRKDESTHKELTARLKNLRKEARDLGQFSAALEDMLKAEHWKWLERCPPLDLEDPRIRDLEEQIEDPGPLFERLEAIKFQILAARSDKLSVGERQMALNEALHELDDFASSFAEYDRLLAPLFEDERFEGPSYNHALFQAYVSAWFTERKERFEELHALTGEATLWENALTLRKLMGKHGTLSADEPQGYAELAQKLIDEPLGHYEMLLVTHCVHQLCAAGKTKEARAIYQASKHAVIGSDAEQGRSGFRLGMLRQIKRSEAMYPLIQYFRETVLPVMLEDYQVNEEARNVLRSSELVAHTLEEAFGMRLFWLSREGFLPENFMAWVDLLENYARLRHDRMELLLEWLLTGLSKLERDEEKAMLIRSSLMLIDVDARERAIDFFEQVEKLIDKKEDPRSWRQLRINRQRMASRHGEKLKREWLLDGEGEEPLLPLSYRLRHLYIYGSDAELGELLDETDPDELFLPSHLDITIRIMQRLGREEELEMALEEAHRYQDIAEARAMLDQSSYHAYRALRLAEVLGPESLAEGWMEYVLERVRDDVMRADLQMREAAWKEDWETLYSMAAQMKERYPTHYIYDWFAGWGAHEAGKREEARKHLSTYTQHANDEFYVLEARERLKALGE